MFLLAFGKGKVEVKLYSDYFCGACKNLEPNVEYLIADLVQRNIITITFVDALCTSIPVSTRGISFTSSTGKRR
jgi:thiol:disulfide interchange protein DsbA